VLVWIYGGAFVTGDGTDTYYGPHYLLQEDIVVVTLNYRLGPLGKTRLIVERGTNHHIPTYNPESWGYLFAGFLSTNTSHASGNWGLKDQVAALRWVQKNIKNFGGDPNQVTIYGQSAGAASVYLHLFSPLSKGNKKVYLWPDKAHSVLRLRHASREAGILIKADHQGPGAESNRNAID